MRLTGTAPVSLADTTTTTVAGVVAVGPDLLIGGAETLDVRDTEVADGSRLFVEDVAEGFVADLEVHDTRGPAVQMV